MKDDKVKIPDPPYKPDVPEYAERISILEHVRHQFHPTFLNAIGGPDIHGPKNYLGIEFRCPFCQKIQALGPPGQEGACMKCDLRYKYTAVKGNTWMWIWKPQPKLDLDGPAQPKKPLIEVPIGGAVEVERAFRPGAPKRDPHKSAAISHSGFRVNTEAKKKDK